MNVAALDAPPATPAPAPAPGFWRRRVVAPLLAQLTQGVTPDKLALTLGVGTACSFFPFFGFTWLLNLGVGLALRMNQPILQTLNQLLGPVQLALILVYVRGGELLWGAGPSQFTIAEMLRIFREASFGDFLARFGWAGVYAFTAWACTVPFLIVAVTFAVRPALRRLARKGSA